MTFRMKAIKTDGASAPLVDLDRAERGTDLEVHTSGAKGPEDQQDDFKVTPGFYKNKEGSSELDMSIMSSMNKLRLSLARSFLENWFSKTSQDLKLIED